MIPRPLYLDGEVLGAHEGRPEGRAQALPCVIGILLFHGTQPGELTGTDLPN